MSSRASADETPVLENALVESVYQQNELVPCTCGVFLSGQFIRGSADPPKGNAALMHELEDKFPCTLLGNKQCTNKCLDIVCIRFFCFLKYLKQIKNKIV